MTQSTHGYEPGDWRRVCDQCGVLYNRSQLHRKMQYVFCSTCDEPGDRIQEEEDAAIARMEPFLILPAPYAKPNVLDSPQVLEGLEAPTFNFVATAAPGSVVGGASNVTAAAWAALYMASVLVDATRPAVWLTTARTVLDRCLTYLLTQQYGSATGTAGVASNPRYGGFLSGGNYATSNVVAAGLAFLRSYQVTGTPEHIAAANRCATFIRHAQCGDLQVTDFTVYPPGSSSPYHIGGLSAGITDSTGLLIGTYQTTNISALWFLSELADEVGASARYGDAAATAFFSAATSATIETMLSELSDFATVGAKDSASAGAFVTGLSTTAPRQAYLAALNTGGAGAWLVEATISGNALSLAIRGLFESSGLTSLVSDLLAWLAAFGANSANATPSGNSPQQTLNGITGTYDPAVCIADSLNAAAPFTEATGALYSWSSLGILASALAGNSPAALASSRNTLSTGQIFNVNLLDVKYLGPLGLSGLNLQPNTTATASVPDVANAARASFVYRERLSDVH